MRRLLMGTRGSALAMWQANWVRDALLRVRPDLRINLQVIRTRGDKEKDAAVNPLDGRGIFTKEIERALLTGLVDMAVHSLKDLPTRLADGLALAAVTVREDPADVVLARAGLTLERLPDAAKVMTGSLRRRAQLLHRRPDLVICPVRGNIQTRLRKFDEADADAILLARAGLARLDLVARISERLDPADFLPACGQGALAVEIQADDGRLAELCRPLDDFESRTATCAERSFLAALGGGCQVPVGAYARFACDPPELTITGMVANLDGSRLLLHTVSGPAAGREEAAALGRELAELLRAAGGRGILEEVVSQSASGGESRR